MFCLNLTLIRNLRTNVLFDWHYDNKILNYSLRKVKLYAEKAFHD